MQGMSTIKKVMSMYLGGPLMLTTTTYEAIRAIEFLPPPLEVDPKVPIMTRSGRTKSEHTQRDKKDKQRNKALGKGTPSSYERPTQQVSPS